MWLKAGLLMTVIVVGLVGVYAVLLGKSGGV
jgi:hypothetical protein